MAHKSCSPRCTARFSRKLTDLKQCPCDTSTSSDRDRIRHPNTAASWRYSFLPYCRAAGPRFMATVYSRVTSPTCKMWLKRICSRAKCQVLQDKFSTSLVAIELQ